MIIACKFFSFSVARGSSVKESSLSFLDVRKYIHIFANTKVAIFLIVRVVAGGIYAKTFVPQ